MTIITKKNPTTYQTHSFQVLYQTSSNFHHEHNKTKHIIIILKQNLNPHESVSLTQLHTCHIFTGQLTINSSFIDSIKIPFNNFLFLLNFHSFSYTKSHCIKKTIKFGYLQRNPNKFAFTNPPLYLFTYCFHGLCEYGAAFGSQGSENSEPY